LRVRSSASGRGDRVPARKPWLDVRAQTIHSCACSSHAADRVTTRSLGAASRRSIRFQSSSGIRRPVLEVRTEWSRDFVCLRHGESPSASSEADPTSVSRAIAPSDRVSRQPSPWTGRGRVVAHSSSGANARRAREGVGDPAPENGQRLPARLGRAVPKCLRAAQTWLRLKLATRDGRRTSAGVAFPESAAAIPARGR
jgi:hypothetical protein